MKLDGRTCQRTLAWVNRIRAERGWGPLSELPKGYRADFASCPVAKATGKRVGYYPTYWDHEGRLVLSEAPAYVREFVDAFDAGRIPELIA